MRKTSDFILSAGKGIVYTLFAVIAGYLFLASLFSTCVMSYTDEHIYYIKDVGPLMAAGLVILLFLISWLRSRKVRRKSADSQVDEGSIAATPITNNQTENKTKASEQHGHSSLPVNQRTNQPTNRTTVNGNHITKPFLIITILWLLLLSAMILIINLGPDFDPGSVYIAAQRFLQGDYQDWQQAAYMYTFPFQGGLMLLELLFFLLFGYKAYLAIQFYNLALWLGTIILITRLTEQYFGKIAAKVTYYALLVFVPMWAYVTYVYGTVPGLFFSVLAIYLEQRYEQSCEKCNSTSQNAATNILKTNTNTTSDEAQSTAIISKTGNIKYLLGMTLSTFLAVMYKSNYQIFAIALIIMLVLFAIKQAKAYVNVNDVAGNNSNADTTTNQNITTSQNTTINLNTTTNQITNAKHDVREKQFANTAPETETVQRTVLTPTILAIILVALAAFLEGPIILSLLATITGAEVHNGVPMIAWIAMGLRDSSIAPGWYNQFTLITYADCNYDITAVKQASYQSIGETFALFRDNMAYTASFFGRKIASMWNSPEFECFTTINKRNKTSMPYYLKDILYNGGIVNTLLFLALDVLQSILYFGMVLHLLCNRSKLKLEHALGIIIFLGGFIFHLFWEGKCQYTIAYFVMLIPYAIEGWTNATEKISRALADKMATKPVDKATIKTAAKRQDITSAVTTNHTVRIALIITTVVILLSIAPANMFTSSLKLHGDEREYIYFLTTDVKWKAPDYHYEN